MTGLDLISIERRQQIEIDGFDVDHDAQYTSDELAWASCYYAMPRPLRMRYTNTFFCPEDLFQPTGWGEEWAKREKKSRIEQLIVAGALIAAEIDRLQAEGGAAND